MALAASTFTFGMAIPTMSMPVLFPEISAELGLTIVEVGWVWGASSFMGILIGLIGGVLGDRFGTRRMLTICCLVAGALGALRGGSSGFITLALTSFLFGLIPSFLPMNVHKVCAIWFPGNRLGMANGIVSAGMAFGFMVASVLSASILSPLLGGWRNVLFLYGAISAIIGILWFFTQTSPNEVNLGDKSGKQTSMKDAIVHIAGLRSIWFVALAGMGFNACVQGTLGYLPTHLTQIGWSDAAAGNAVGTFHAASLLATIPIALLSDRLGFRRIFLMIAALMMASGTGLLSVVVGPGVWVGVILAGVIRDAFMALFMTVIVELKGIGATFAGTATGLVIMCMSFGRTFSPPLGNSLVAINPSLPFLFWGALALLAFGGLYALKEVK
ncbi:MFS transporter [Chloroflexi bacterium TSY]|nr:MFS transporter [Chloroflexi bacterium TSY]